MASGSCGRDHPSCTRLTRTNPVGLKTLCRLLQPGQKKVKTCKDNLGKHCLMAWHSDKAICGNTYVIWVEMTGAEVRFRDSQNRMSRMAWPSGLVYGNGSPLHSIRSLSAHASPLLSGTDGDDSLTEKLPLTSGQSALRCLTKMLDTCPRKICPSLKLSLPVITDLHNFN